MKVISVKEMYSLDQKTCERLNIGSFELMNKAASAINDYIKNFVNKTHKVVVVAGKGNNGGDAIILHQLMKNYTNSSLFVFGGPKQSSENKQALNCTFSSDPELFKKEVQEATHIIDGLFGIGFKGALNTLSKITKSINQSNAFVYSIDIPSGINGNNGLATKDAVIADECLIVEHYKYGNLLQDAKDYSKKNTIIKIGIIDSSEDSSIIEQPEISQRSHNSHKYNYGSILVIGGSYGMTGAPQMASLAALRSGAGLLHMTIYDKHYSSIKNHPLEVMVHKHSSANDIKNMLYKKSSICFGMGLGREDEINNNICSQLIQSNIPIVIDADGIYYLKENMENITSKVIITPHYRELSYLLGIPINDIKKDPVKHVKELTKNGLITVVLKGPTTIIANRKKMVFSPLGNPGMATAGTGDVLAGIIARFLIDDPFDAALKGVYIHSMAADFAARELGQESLIATDIINQIPNTIKRLQE